jgi:endonuclease YncB( thermonuclease family)
VNQQKSLINSQKLTPYLFLFPAIALLGLTVFFPAIQAFALSFTRYEYDITQPLEWISLENFQRHREQSPWGAAAKEKLTALVMGKPIAIEVENPERDYPLGRLRDRYDRLIGHLWQGETLVSQELVKSGCALVNDRYSHSYSKLLMESQEYARLMGYGIWNPKLAMRHTPSQFRSMNKP